MKIEHAKNFAEEWIASWNAHDLERILAHYRDDFEMSSPYIAQFTGEASGVLRGKIAVESYWKIALERVPDLHFELREVFAGADSIAIFYNGALGRRVVEVLWFDENGQVVKAAAHYDI